MNVSISNEGGSRVTLGDVVVSSGDEVTTVSIPGDSTIELPAAPGAFVSGLNVRITTVNGQTNVSIGMMQNGTEHTRDIDLAAGVTLAEFLEASRDDGLLQEGRLAVFADTLASDVGEHDLGSMSCTTG